MRCRFLAALISVLAFMAPSVCASSPGESTAAAAPRNYQLRSEDVIEITVLGIPQLDKTATILPDGTINYPRLNTIHVAGMTPSELQRYLYQRLDQFYNNLDITVTVKTLRTDRVTIRGAVKNPGIYVMQRGWTVRELLAAAGDVVAFNGPPDPNQMRAVLIRRDGQRVPLDLAQILSDQGTTAVPVLEPDDVLMIEDLTIQVWVDGFVTKPGLVTLPHDATALDALKAAGGATEKAALSKAMIRRDNRIIPVDLRPSPAGVSAIVAAPLQRNDTLVVPENKDRFVVLGGVNKPGAIVIPEDQTIHLTDALALAGGGVAHAKLREISLLRNVDGKQVRTVLNLDQMLKKGTAGQDILIHAGDVLYVPDPKQPNSVFNPVAILQSAALLFGL